MIYIVRHGQTEVNKKKALQGRTNAPLNEEGKSQASALGAYFREQGILFEKVYASPLIRAVETARLIVGENVPIETDERLLEMDYGPYEGVDLEQPPEEIIRFFSDFVHQPAPEGMEPLDEVVRRLGDFLCKSDFEVSPGKNVLISTHAIAMKGALEYLTPESNGSYWSKYIPNCGVYFFEKSGAEFREVHSLKRE